MPLLDVLLFHAGPWGGPGGPGNGEWGHHFGFFPFFPGLFWLGLIVFFAIMRSGGGRWHRRHSAATSQPPRANAEPTTGPAWPDLDPAPAPPPAPKRNDEGIEMF